MTNRISSVLSRTSTRPVILSCCKDRWMAISWWSISSTSEKLPCRRSFAKRILSTSFSLRRMLQPLHREGFAAMFAAKDLCSGTGADALEKTIAVWLLSL